MNKFIKQHKLSFTVGIILCLVGLNVYLYKDSRYLSGIKDQLQTSNHRLNRDIRDSRLRETKFIRQIQQRNHTIEQLDRKIMEIQVEKRSLSQELSRLRHAVRLAEKQNQASLEDYDLKLAKLSHDLDLSLITAGETEKALGFLRRKSRSQQKVITRQELVYLECQDQLTLKEHKIEGLNLALNRLDRYYKRRCLKKGSIKYTIGIVVGLVAGYFVFKGKR